ncbi:MAG: RrF2 family transcriptional regulator [Myxococcaceae bacterium]
MRASKKADYALRAVLDLALHASPGKLAPTSEIARRTGAPPKFLEAIVSELRRAGLVDARRGAEGGLRLARPVGRITAGDVWRAIDGPLGGHDHGRKPTDPAARATRSLWDQVDRAIEREVDAVTLEDLARRATASNVPDFNI